MRDFLSARNHSLRNKLADSEFYGEAQEVRSWYLYSFSRHRSITIKPHHTIGETINFERKGRNQNTESQTNMNHGGTNHTFYGAARHT